MISKAKTSAFVNVIENWHKSIGIFIENTGPDVGVHHDSWSQQRMR